MDGGSTSMHVPANQGTVARTWIRPSMVRIHPDSSKENNNNGAWFPKHLLCYAKENAVESPSNGPAQTVLPQICHASYTNAVCFLASQAGDRYQRRMALNKQQERNLAKFLCLGFVQSFDSPAMRWKKSSLISQHSCITSGSMRSTCTPACFKMFTPFPSTKGLGSTYPTTTRDTCASRSAYAQGGVLPKCAHGSRLTYAVAPLAFRPAARSAYTSACGFPAWGWYPSPTTVPSRTTTHPTAGLGAVFPFPRFASASARAMCIRSVARASISPPDARAFDSTSLWDRL